MAVTLWRHEAIPCNSPANVREQRKRGRAEERKWINSFFPSDLPVFLSSKQWDDHLFLFSRPQVSVEYRHSLTADQHAVTFQ